MERRRRELPGQRRVINGLPGSARSPLAQLERSGRIEYGETVEGAFRRWKASAYSPRHHDESVDSGMDYSTGHVRGTLEVALHHLRPRARRRLRALLDPIDARMLERTVNNPFAAAWLPWWRRRMES